MDFHEITNLIWTFLTAVSLWSGPSSSSPYLVWIFNLNCKFSENSLLFTSRSIYLDTQPPGEVNGRLQEGGGGLLPEPARLLGRRLRVHDVLGCTQADSLPSGTVRGAAAGNDAHTSISYLISSSKHCYIIFISCHRKGWSHLVLRAVPTLNKLLNKMNNPMFY